MLLPGFLRSSQHTIPHTPRPRTREPSNEMKRYEKAIDLEIFSLFVRQNCIPMLSPTLHEKRDPILRRIEGQGSPVCFQFLFVREMNVSTHPKCSWG